MDLRAHLKTPPSIGPPATMREVEKSWNAVVHAPAGRESRIPSQTPEPDAMSDPSVAKHESTARAGLFAATVESGFARMFVIHSSITANASGVWSEARAGRA